ncbi:MAG: ABC transporter ATP-binding protein [Candidatus Limnocylindria bacterium]
MTTPASSPQPAQTGPAVLSTSGLTKRYGRDTWALRDINLAVPAGGVTALIGPNAAGKSTLLKTWVGFERPTHGSVAVSEVDPWRDRSAALSHLAYVAQRPSLYAELTGDEHFTLARHLRAGFDTDAARRRLAQLGIPSDRAVGELSGGQAAQLSLAIALGTHADVLLLDEPLASLDPLARREFLTVLREAVAADGSTALLSSHVVSDVVEGCDRLLVLGVGRLLLHAPIADALNEHTVVESPDGHDPSSSDLISVFVGQNGEQLALVRSGPRRGRRSATLEEIVVGYLTAGRADERRMAA